MITKSAKETSAHQAMLSVSFCHFRMSHMSEPYAADHAVVSTFRSETHPPLRVAFISARIRDASSAVRFVKNCEANEG